MSKEKLDEIIEKYKAQPVGHGYIDIIVYRDNYKDFISELVTHNYKIKSISWWEWCPDKKKNEYGLGGPKSKYYAGWFSELSVDLDYVPITPGLQNEQLINEVIKMVETKTISFPKEIITFENNHWLTPAFWLDVPGTWRNREYLSKT